MLVLPQKHALGRGKGSAREPGAVEGRGAEKALFLLVCTHREAELGS